MNLQDLIRAWDDYGTIKIMVGKRIMAKLNKIYIANYHTQSILKH